MTPYRPAFATAFNNSVPAVITPLPPLPASAMEMLAPSARCCAPACARLTDWPIAFILSLFDLDVGLVNRLRGRIGLIQINAPAFPFVHDITRK
jgi:hypothetical protein